MEMDGKKYNDIINYLCLIADIEGWNNNGEITIPEDKIDYVKQCLEDKFKDSELINILIKASK